MLTLPLALDSCGSPWEQGRFSNLVTTLFMFTYPVLRQGFFRTYVACKPADCSRSTVLAVHPCVSESMLLSSAVEDFLVVCVGTQASDDG